MQYGIIAIEFNLRQLDSSRWRFISHAQCTVFAGRIPGHAVQAYCIL